jgi:hypothetical protein
VRLVHAIGQRENYGKALVEHLGKRTRSCRPGGHPEREIGGAQVFEPLDGLAYRTRLREDLGVHGGTTEAGEVVETILASRSIRSQNQDEGVAERFVHPHHGVPPVRGPMTDPSELVAHEREALEDCSAVVTVERDRERSGLGLQRIRLRELDPRTRREPREVVAGEEISTALPPALGIEQEGDEVHHLPGALTRSLEVELHPALLLHQALEFAGILLRDGQVPGFRLGGRWR